MTTGSSRKATKRPRRGRVCVLSRKRELYSTSRLVEAIKAEGQRALVMDTLRCAMVLGPEPRMLYRGAEVDGLTVVLPRIGASITGYGVAVVGT